MARTPAIKRTSERKSPKTRQALLQNQRAPPSRPRESLMGRPRAGTEGRSTPCGLWPCARVLAPFPRKLLQVVQNRALGPLGPRTHARSPIATPAAPASQGEGWLAIEGVVAFCGTENLKSSSRPKASDNCQYTLGEVSAACREFTLLPRGPRSRGRGVQVAVYEAQL